MSWWTPWRRTPTTTGGLVEPFEYWDDDLATGEPQRQRPLLYMLEHVVLPDALFKHRPAMQQLLQGGPQAHEGLLHLMSHAALRCQGNSGWPDDLTTIAARYEAYVKPLLDAMRVTRHDHPTMPVWTLRLPAPLVTAEAHHAAFVRPEAAVDPFDFGGSGPRYFVLEKTYGENACCLCEWAWHGDHENHGETPLIDEAAFANMVRRVVAQAD